MKSTTFKYGVSLTVRVPDKVENEKFRVRSLLLILKVLRDDFIVSESVSRLYQV